MKNMNPELEQLVAKLLLNRRLYTEGRAEMPDEDYDKLEEQIRSLDPEHPSLKQVGFEVDVNSSNKVKHHIPMLSLGKTYALDDLHQWIKKRPVIGMFKIDGASLSLVYKSGKFAIAKTRGNGLVGEDVTDKVNWVKDCVKKLNGKALESSESIEVRGELYCSVENFSLLLAEMEKLGLEKPSNPRNIVAGILGRKQHIELARFFNFYAFDLFAYDENEPFPRTELEKLEILSKFGFSLATHKLLENESDLEKFLEHTKNYMQGGEVGIDGAVFTLNDISLHKELGNTAHHPRYKISYKWQGETSQTKIKDFIWNTSRLGILTPVAVVEPVNLSGAKISNVTLHNASYIKNYNLKIGDTIEIVRSGEVIPKFLQVVESCEGKYSFPSVCASCQSVLKYDEIRLECTNENNCPAQVVGSILNWIRCVEIDDLSEKRLLHLIEGGYVKEISDLYKLTKEDFLELPLTKAKMAEKLWSNIQKSRNMPLSHFLNGLGFKGVGLTSWKLILESFPSIDEVRKVSTDDLIAIKGFAEKSAEQITQGFIEKSDLIDSLLAVEIKPAEQLKADNIGLFSGKQFAITGTLSTPRNEIKKKIESKGGKVSSSISSKTFALIIADPESKSSKAVKASQLGVELWSEEKMFSELEKV